MKRTSIAAFVVVGIITLVPGTFASAAEMNPTRGSAVNTSSPDVTVMPGTGAGALHLHFSGAERLSSDMRGGLIVYKATGRMHYRPEAYQVINGKRKYVEVSFHVDTRDQATVRFDKIDENTPVILDRGALMFNEPM